MFFLSIFFIHLDFTAKNAILSAIKTERIHMSKVIVFGGSGWVGHNIVIDLIKHNYDVTVCSRGRNNKFTSKISNVKTVNGDKQDENFIRELFAAETFDYVIDTVPTMQSIANIFKYAKNIKQYIHCSSTGGYAPLPFIPCNESAPYGGFESNSGWAAKAKYDNEVMRLFKEENFPATVIRPCYITGPGGLLPLDNFGGRREDFISDIAAEKTMDLPDNGQALLQPIHVEDLARSFRLAIEHPVSIGEIYNITLEHALTIRRYIELNAQALGKKAHINYIPLEEMCRKYSDSINDTWLRFFATHMCFSIDKARNEIGYIPEHTAEETIIASAQYAAEILGVK